MKRLTVYFLIAAACLQAGAETASGQIPVLLRVAASDQNDSLGCNLVNDITSLAYQEVMNGMKLWDSPQKEIRITASTLKEIERSSETSFITQPVIYIYEFWSGSGKNLKTVTAGFGFFNKNKKGEDVSYGYVDMNDFRNVLHKTTANTNPNGNYNTPLARYLGSKSFNFNIIQYGSRVVDNAAESDRIKEEATKGTFIYPDPETAWKEIPQKLITYDISFNEGADSAASAAAEQLRQAVRNYLDSNYEVFFNLGGDRILNYLGGKKRPEITAMQVKEIWKKIDGQISHDPVAVTIFVHDTALNEVLYRDMIKLEIMVGLKSWVDVIREKPFAYFITSVNSQPVKKTEAYLYRKALLSEDWKQITEFIKRY